MTNTNRIKSFTVTRDRDNRPRITASHWKPGYTPAHHGNKASAVAYALRKAITEASELKTYTENLARLLEELNQADQARLNHTDRTED